MVHTLLLGTVLATTLCAAMWFFLSSPAPSTSPTRVAPTDLASPVTTTAAKVEAGRLFMIGHWTETPVASTTELIETHGFGGVIIMDAPTEPTDLTTWIEEWNSVSEVPLLIAIDQEGGPVSRLRGADFIQTGQRRITDLEHAYKVGQVRGRELAALGITMNFAPVLDTAQNPSSFMYDRSFASASSAPALAATMIDGMANESIVAVPKHFPGHDDTSSDSHVTLPVVEIDQTELDSFTAPFQSLLAIHPPRAIMTAHVLFPHVDDVPATLSPFFLTSYLRETLRYDGVIITDDMSMDAITESWSIASSTVMALDAGANLVLFAAEPTAAIDALESVQTEAARDNGFEEKLRRSVERVQLLRTTF